MKLLVISFHPIKQQELDQVLYRHQADKEIFSAFLPDHRIIHVKMTVGGNTIQPEGNEERYFPGKRGFFYAPLKLYRFVKKERPDVVFLHGFVFPFQVWLLRRVLPSHTRILVQHHAELPFTNPLKSFIQRMAYKDASLYLFASKELALPFAKRRVLDPGKVVEVMEVSTLFEPMDRTMAREKLKIGSGQVFVWVGRLDENKDPLTVLEAMALYAKKNRDFRLYMIYGTSGLEEDVKRKIKDLNLFQHVFLLGKRKNEEVRQWLSATDYYISASHYEGSGVALCEALACGAVPIVTNIPSFRSMTRQGSCGYVYEPGDVMGLGRVLESLPEKPGAHEREKAQTIFREDLSPSAISARLYAEVSKLVKG